MNLLRLVVVWFILVGAMSLFSHRELIGVGQFETDNYFDYGP